MMIYLIECGSILVLYIKEQQQYFIVDKNSEYLKQFISDELNCDQWQSGKSFQFDQNTFTDNTQDLEKEKTLGKNILIEDLLTLFYLPENNPGAVIASRSESQSAPAVYNRYRFKSLCVD